MESKEEQYETSADLLIMRALNQRVADYEKKLNALHQCMMGVFGADPRTVIIPRNAPMAFVVDMIPFCEAMGGHWKAISDHWKEAQKHTLGSRDKPE